MYFKDRKLKKVFIGGPIQHAIGPKGFDSCLRSAITFLINTLQHEGFEVFSAHNEERFGDIDMESQSEEITFRDFCWARDCDAYVCLLPANEYGKPYRSDGTHIEIGWASAYGKNIVILFDPSVSYSHLINGLHSIAPVTLLPIESVLNKPSILITILQDYLYKYDDAENVL